MGSKRATTDQGLALALSFFYAILLLLLVMAGFGSSDLAQDRAECADKVAALISCLPYVSGEANAPTMECCSGLKEVLDKSKKCICILIKDRNDPSLGLKINATLAVQLPSACNAPANISECVNLLHLAPNSPEAKEFEELAKVAGKNSSTPVSNERIKSAADGRSVGGWGKRWLMAEVACWILPLAFISNLFFLL